MERCSRERATPRLTIRNSGVLASTDYDALLDAADLLITDNAVSVTIGRAASKGVPVVCQRNRRRLLDIVRGDDPASRDGLRTEAGNRARSFRSRCFLLE